MQEINFDYEKILNIVLTGVSRAAIFMGFGINSARNPDHKNYLLTDITAINLVPTQVDDKTLTEFKNDFSTWIVGNGLSEVNKAFEIFLDKIYEATTYLSIVKKEGVAISALTLRSITDKINKFSNKKFPEKFEILNKEFGISTEGLDCHLSLKNARNCLVHRYGRIIKRDCNEGSSLVIKWIGIDYFILRDNQEIQMIDTPIKEPIFVKEGGNLCCKFSKRSIKFPKNSTINLSPKNVFEICVFYKLESEKITNLAVQYIKENSDIFDKLKTVKIV